ncbi:hypothetical protein E2E30_08580 [Sphingomonas sp. AAP5]|jgi:hypothetical protein|uniref:Uncharacterized protein n=1 Tax=Sphingomonas glacialis TaxID=658225 RepID=A0ABQ3LG11_9SPHN|nr:MULTISPECIES: hypothetical protein [Sphingomonas]MDY7525287.1 hypothetical protein [Sphingomonas sp. 10B4]MEB0282765.1 hypothetical protein [Sphingomonas sp. 10B4]QBM75820.1 hypothetical protein E2E30_08580 [Sphingomonas sp. AAP5]GHH09988.1 hypothetical protein GCM10008023_07290 [Sphingomonas glacialis]
MTARSLSPSEPAVLFRSRAEWPDEIERAVLEQIGDGPLAKMIRIAMTDPDEELWRYSISVSGQTIAGKAIRALELQ